MVASQKLPEVLKQLGRYSSDCWKHLLKLLINKQMLVGKRKF